MSFLLLFFFQLCHGSIQRMIHSSASGPLLTTTRTAIGIIIGYLGVLILLSQGEFTRMPDIDWLGVALALASTVLWAAYWLMNTRATSPPLTLMAWSFLFATPLLAGVCFLGPGLPPITPETLAYGAWVGGIELGFTFLLWQQALRLTDNAARMGQLIFLAPFLSFALIATVLGETIHATSLAGLAVIVTGLVISGRRDQVD